MNRNIPVLIILVVIAEIAINSGCSSVNDSSLTPEEYQKMGMPDPSRSWSTKEYLEAHALLGKLRSTKPRSFPMKNSKKSGVVFNRIMNRDNLSYLNDTSLLLSDRAFEIMHFSSFLNELSRMYTNELSREQFYNEELVDIYFFRLYVHGKMLELAGQIMNSDEPSSKGMKSGTQAVVYGYIKVIISILEEQVKSDVYKKADLNRLSVEVCRSVKENLAWIGPTEKEKITEGIRSVIRNSPSKFIKKNYQELLDLLQ